MTRSAPFIARLRITLLLLCSLLADLSQGHAAEASIQVISSSASNIDSLTREEIRQIYMGGPLSHKYHALSLPQGHSLRKRFSTSIIGLTENRIQSYWAQLLFTGRSTPPKEIGSIEEIVEHIVNTKHTVGYVPADTVLPDSVKVLYQQ